LSVETTVTRPLRVAYVIDKLARHGAQKILVHLTRRLAAKPYQQRVYSLNNIVHPDHQYALQQAGVQVRSFSKCQILSGLGILRLYADWLRWRPDLVFTMLFYSDVIGRVTAKLSGVPIIVSSIRARNSYQYRLQFYLDRLTAPWADRVVFNTQDVIPYAIQHEGIHATQIVYIPNGVERLTPTTDSAQLHAMLNVPVPTPLIAAVGRLHPEKGFADLLHAFATLRQQGTDGVLVFAGDGKLRRSLQTLAEHLNIQAHIRFLGERTDVLEILSGVDVYVQTSLYEGMSNALMEAMALGKPVIATAVGGTLELITDGQTGWFIAPENPAQLADKLGYVLNHPDLAWQVGQAAAIRMTQEFSIEKMVDAYDQLFRDLIAEKLGSD
jgi:glycosyltransferase involved in cell wall biosynthesis